MTIAQFLFLLATHWVGDFVLQTHWQASNKSKNNLALLAHVGVYTIMLAWVTPVIFSDITRDQYLQFISANAVLHLVTDYFTSRISSRLYAKGDWHNFFVVIGFDQLIHQFTLAITALRLIG